MSYTLSQQIQTLLQTHTQKQVADMYGVSDRAIRHWRDGDRQPRDDNTRKGIHKDAARVRRKLIREGSYELDVPVQTKKIKDTTYYRTRKTNEQLKFDLLKKIRDNGKRNRSRLTLVRFVVRIPKGGTSPGGREFKKGGHYSTSYINIHGYSDVELWEMIEQNNTHGTIVEIVEVGKKQQTQIKGKRK